MKNILITGNSGYIGSHLTKLLQSKHPEYNIYGMDLNDPIIEPHQHHHADIRNVLYWKKKYDCVIHLAALVNVGESEQNPISYYNTNLIGTLNVLEQIPTRNFIFASTGAAEKCESAYGISKRAAEDVVRQYCTKNNIEFSIFRFYNVIGSDGIKPTNPDGLFYNLLKTVDTKRFTIYGNDYNTSDGTCIRDYVHVLEICNSLSIAIHSPSMTVENLGHGVGHSVKEMVDLFKKVNNVDFDVEFGPRRKGDIEVSVLDNPSDYLTQMFSIEQLLKVDNNLTI